MNRDQHDGDTEDAVRGAALMGRYCEGEAAAFQELYAWLAPRILAYLCGLTGDRASAEDVLQVAFLKLHQARSVYVRDANPVPWIYTIAHRACLDELRKRKRSKVRLAADPDALPELPADMTGTAEHASDDALDDQADSGGAVRALALLPENQREALLLTKVHGRSVAEAAAITGTTSGAIKLRVHRGYTTLRRLFKNKQEMESRP
jgi:RNA polymerase sigma factor (sigma-70 family)